MLYLSRRGDIGPGNCLITIRSDATGEERILKPYLRFINQMSWAPDGSNVVFQTDSTVSTIALIGGEPKELIRGLAKYNYLKWTH